MAALRRLPCFSLTFRGVQVLDITVRRDELYVCIPSVGAYEGYGCVGWKKSICVECCNFLGRAWTVNKSVLNVVRHLVAFALPIEMQRPALR